MTRLIFGCALLLYLPYAFYYDAHAPLHGDESQYLRTTQSLVHDHDLDLSNNMGQTGEFHRFETDVHMHPLSPPGKIYSAHPVGLSLLMVPAYAWGRIWGNPRLACVLLMAIMGAACLPLMYRWLAAWEHSSPLIGTIIMGSTVPFLFHSLQIFPEIPALLIALIILNATVAYQRGSQHRSWGTDEPFVLALLMLLAGGLTFLHPRFALLSAVLSLPLLLQGWNSPLRGCCLTGILLALGWIFAGHILLNQAITGTYLGSFSPGVMWKLNLSTWWVSLPGHWLSLEKGLLNSSPVYVLTLSGLLVVSTRQKVIAGLLYGATAGIYGLHPHWDFGFSYPARFMVTALPALLLCLHARGLVWLFLPLSWNATYVFLLHPEWGFNGQGLTVRTLVEYFPYWNTLFFPRGQVWFPTEHIMAWGLLVLSLVLCHIRRHRR